MTPHGPLQAFGPKLWVVTGKLPRGSMPRNMVVAKLASGGLLIHSAVALDEKTTGELARLGEPEVMIVPCPLHRLDAAVWKSRYPKLRVLAPRAAMIAAAKVVPVDGSCEDHLATHGVKWHAPKGLKPYELWYEFDTGSGTALALTDSLMNLPNLPGFDGWLMRLIGSTGFFGITRIGRMMLLKDKAAYRAWLKEMAAIPALKAVIMAHGEPVTGDAKGALLAAAERV